MLEHVRLICHSSYIQLLCVRMALGDSMVGKIDENNTPSHFLLPALPAVDTV